MRHTRPSVNSSSTISGLKKRFKILVKSNISLKMQATLDCETSRTNRLHNGLNEFTQNFNNCLNTEVFFIEFIFNKTIPMRIEFGNIYPL